MSHRSTYSFCLNPCLFASLVALCPAAARPGDLGEVAQFHVAEIAFTGPDLGPKDTPTREVELSVTFEHQSGQPAIRAWGFWDSDGRGGSRGNAFKVRFCPVKTGTWRIVEVQSDRPELRDQHRGDTLTCVASDHPGLWIPDGRWYRRSDGSHLYIIGNTHYTFLSRQSKSGPVKTDPVEDIRAGSKYYTKLRFSLFGGRYPDPKVKPFLDDDGRQTDDGRFSQRPNPAWFHQRVDPVVAEGFKQDMICDLILCGPDTVESRSTLKGDPEPWLRYVAARYGAYPNVWFCLANEWNIKNPKYTADEIRGAGATIRKYLAYPSPVSVHRSPGDWPDELSGPWHDHVILQAKIKDLARSADLAAKNYNRVGKPVVNDENAYEGDGDRFSEGDTIEGGFGTFCGGAYPSTGEKYGSKLGQYVWGGFDADKHKASDNLLCLRNYVDEHVAFWQMKPIDMGSSPFSVVPKEFRLLANPGREYVLGSDRAAEGIRVKLPDGHWGVTQVDLIRIKTTTLAERADGEFRFNTPDSRATLTHFKRYD